VSHTPITYTVQQGDTIKTIAEHFQLTVAEIRWTNPSLESKGRAVPGDRLLLPPVHGVVVTLREGESPATLATTWHVDATAIADFNYLRDPDLVPPGSVLVVPGARGPDLSDWDSVAEIIRRAFAPQGPEAVSWAMRIAACESHYNPNAVNRGSNASGLFQFLPSTWAASPYGGSSVFDANANAQAAAWLYRTAGPSQWQCR
jgi:LysM repeat protein